MSARTSRKFVCTALVLLGSLPSGVRPQNVDTQLVSAQLVSELSSIRERAPFWVAIRLEMRPGWHVNWINPGDAGLPPSVTWDLPAGFAASELRWPFPQRFALPELLIFGYAGEVFLLAEITPPRSLRDRSVTLKARVDWLACAEACVPGVSNVRVELPVESSAPMRNPRWASSFDSARAKLPVDGSDWGLAARVSNEKIAISLVPPAETASRLEEVRFFPAVPGVIENSSPQSLTRTADGYRLDIQRSRASVQAPSRIRGVLVSGKGWGPAGHRALAVDLPVELTTGTSEMRH